MSASVVPSQAYLDHDTYSRYRTGVEFSLKGAKLFWRDIPAVERDRVVALIQAHAESLAATYTVDLDLRGDDARLALEHRHSPTGAQVADLKGVACGLLILTSWGGGR